MDVLTTRQAAQALGVTDESVVRHLILDGRLRAVKLGRDWVIERSAGRVHEAAAQEEPDAESGGGETAMRQDNVRAMPGLAFVGTIFWWNGAGVFFLAASQDQPASVLVMWGLLALVGRGLQLGAAHTLAAYKGRSTTSWVLATLVLGELALILLALLPRLRATTWGRDWVTERSALDDDMSGPRKRSRPSRE